MFHSWDIYISIGERLPVYSDHRNLTFYSENIRSNVKKYYLLYIKKHKECNASIILRYTKLPYTPKITNKKKSDHSFLYPSHRQHKNVPAKIVNPLVNAFSTEISLIFYCLFQIFRPSRKPFRDVTLYCKAAVSIELIDIISLVLKYIYVYHLILNIFLEITSKHICPYYFFKKRYLTRVNREKPIRRRNSVNISLFDWSSLVKHGNKTISNPCFSRT